MVYPPMLSDPDVMERYSGCFFEWLSLLPYEATHNTEAVLQSLIYFFQNNSFEVNEVRHVKKPFLRDIYNYFSDC